MRSIQSVKSQRDPKAVQEILDLLTLSASDQKVNLLELAKEAMRRRATVGEVTYALEKVWGRHLGSKSVGQSIYLKEFGMNSDVMLALSKVEAFRKQQGRNPRILIAKMGQDGHDRGAKVIASGFADLGFDVDLGELFHTPSEVCKQAIEHDVHFIGVSTQAGAHKTLVRLLIDELKKEGAGEIMIVVGGVVPEVDFEELKSMGVRAIFTPGSSVVFCALELLKLLESRVLS
jgi:methylmalonyl-CoA mutase